MVHSRFLVVGCGDTGTALGLNLARQGHKVYGLRRHPESLPGPIEPIQADLTRKQTLTSLPDNLAVVFFLAAPAARTEQAYRAIYVDGLRHLLEAIDEQGRAPRRLFLVSSTSVYGQRNGEWVDETSPAQPRCFTGRILLEAEEMVARHPIAWTIFRAGGIYGPGRAQLLTRVREGTLAMPPKGPVYTNRIHRDDAAGALAFLAQLPGPESLYLGVDDEPCDLEAVARWLARKMRVPLRISRSEPGHSELSGAGKRCRNRKLRSTGYSFIYPTFREGYAAILDEETAPRTGIILISHGTPLGRANERFERLVTQLASSFPGVDVAPAYLSSAHPTIDEQVLSLVSKGILRILLLPYFLHAGTHITQTIPRIIERVRGKHPGASIELLPSLESDPALLDLLIKRIHAALSQ